jgi:hypothetical protein
MRPERSPFEFTTVSEFRSKVETLRTIKTSPHAISEMVKNSGSVLDSTRGMTDRVRDGRRSGHLFRKSPDMVQVLYINNHVGAFLVP